jgi:hypothetical protein
METRKIILWGLFVGINIVWAIINGIMTRDNDKTYHGWSGMLYTVVCIIPILFQLKHPNWLEISLEFLSIISLHASVFAVVYNFERNLPLFNLSKTTTSLFDRFQVWVGLKSSKLFNIGSFIISITLLILSICL